MRPLEGPYFHINEALEKLKISETELSHHIQNDRIQAVIFTKELAFLLFDTSEKGWNGRATCIYRGHLAIDKRVVCKLFDDEQITLGENWGRLLETNGIIEWSHEYPFEKKLPNEPLTSWDPCTEATLDLNATPLPYERIPITTSLRKMLVTLQQTDRNNATPIQAYTPTTEDTSDLVLSLTSNSTFDFSALKIPHSEINNFLSPKMQKSRNELVWEKYLAENKERENQFETLVARIILTDLKIRTKQLWKIIEDDHKRDEPEFDTERIINAIDPSSTDWQSRYGNVITIQFSSFANVVTRARKKLHKILAELDQPEK